MKRLLITVMAFCALGSLALGQKGTAESGYYSLEYRGGDTWTGEVMATNDATREITLTYTKKDKTQTFVGVLREGYKLSMKDGSVHELKVSELAPGTRIKVYYMTTKDKSSGVKVEVNKIYEIKFMPPAGNRPK